MVGGGSPNALPPFSYDTTVDNREPRITCSFWYHYRLVSCNYERIGCPWWGPFHELQGHTTDCAHPKRTGDEIMESLQVIDKKRDAEIMLYQSIFNLLSFEKIAFSGMYLKHLGARFGFFGENFGLNLLACGPVFCFISHLILIIYFHVKSFSLIIFFHTKIHFIWKEQSFDSFWHAVNRKLF